MAKKLMGEIYLEMMRKQKLTQKQVAEAFGVCQQTVNNSIRYIEDPLFRKTTANRNKVWNQKSKASA